MDARGTRALRRRARPRDVAAARVPRLDDALEELGWPDALAARRRAPRSPPSSSSRARPPRPPPRSTSCWRPPWASTLDGSAGVRPPRARAGPPLRDGGRGCVAVDGLALGDARQRDQAPRGRRATTAPHRRRHRADARAAPGRGPRPRASAWSRCSRPTAPSPSDAGDGATGPTPSRPASGRSPTSWSGASRTMLDLAREHAVERVQFDRPIAGFQAVRHRLAETLVAIEAADAALDAAWLRRHARSPRRWPRPSPAAAPAPSPATASRCSPASASPPSTPSTATSGAASCSTASSATPAASPPPLGDDLLATGRLPPSPPSDPQDPQSVFQGSGNRSYRNTGSRGEAVTAATCVPGFRKPVVWNTGSRGDGAGGCQSGSLPRKRKTSKSVSGVRSPASVDGRLIPVVEVDDVRRGAASHRTVVAPRPADDDVAGEEPLIRDADGLPEQLSPPYDAQLVRQAPRPRARAASRKFCMAG